MIDLSKLRLFISIAFIISIISYHLLLGYTHNLSIGSDFLAAIKLSSFATSGLVFWLVISNNFLLRKLLGISYIGGDYECNTLAIPKSSESFGGNEGDLDNHEAIDIAEREMIDVFTINQTLWGVKINGYTYKDENKTEIISTFSGQAYKQDENRYYFGMELSKSNISFVIFVATFSKDGVFGFQYSGRPTAKYYYKTIGKKIN